MNKTRHFSPKKGNMLKHELFLSALAHNNFNVSSACKEVGISRSTYYLWLGKYAWFSDKINELNESKIDLYEEALHQNILNGDTRAIIFGLKTLGKERGYVEKDSVNRKVAALLEDVLADRITVREAAFKINAMGQPLPEILKIELAKVPPEDPNAGEGVSVEELERKAKAAMEAVMNQREYFVPSRQTEVKAIKQALEGADAFRT